MDDEEECPTCGSTDFYDEDGRIFCHNGHDQGRGLATAEDDADFGRQGNVVRKKTEKRKIKLSKVLRGAKAYQLFLQSWQFILWKQCHALVHQKGLPEELWTIVRDLWTLWLSTLEHRLQDATALAEDVNPHQIAKVDTLTSSGSDSETDLDTDVKRQAQKKAKFSYPYPKLIDTIALAYMGIIMLRRPIGQATLLRWILEEDIPFVRAIRHVPQEMKDRLPGEYHQSLDTTTRLPEANDLQKAIYHRVGWFNTSFGMIMPPINENLFLLNYVRRLALPLEVYTMARRLNKITKYDFAYPDMTKSQEAPKRQPTTYPESQLISLVVMATKLLFPFDSDAIKRYPKDHNDPTTLCMNWSSWLEAKSNFDKAVDATRDPNSLKSGSEIHTTDKDILDMTDQQLDKYMDWYQTTWMKNNTPARSTQERGGIDKEILDMFPLHDVPEHPKTLERTKELDANEDALVNERIKQVQQALKSRRAISEEEEIERGLDILRPGARYPRFAKVEDFDRVAPESSGNRTGGDDFNGNHNAVKTFHEEAAATACLGVKALLLAVNRTEEIIEKWLSARKREDYFGDEDLRGSGDDDTTDKADVMDVVPETSPPARLARELSGLGLGLSPYVEEEDDEDVDMEMLPE